MSEDSIEVFSELGTQLVLLVEKSEFSKKAKINYIEVFDKMTKDIENNPEEYLDLCEDIMKLVMNNEKYKKSLKEYASYFLKNSPLNGGSK